MILNTLLFKNMLKRDKMQYIYCDKCGTILSNSFWHNPKAIEHHIKIGFNEDSTHKLTLCLSCFKSVEKQLYDVIQFYFDLEKKSEIEG